jgi:hypothetical protein
MNRTFSLLRSFVVATALLVALCAAHSACAQSVKGSGKYTVASGDTTSFSGRVKVDVYVRRDGSVRGSVTLGNKALAATSLVVVGNQATVTTTNGWTFWFWDNGDGSVEPDEFGYTSGGFALRTTLDGDVKVIP